jgi:hypothetical protein
MMKKMFFLLLAFGVLIPVFAQNQGDFEVQISDANKVTITGYKGTARDIVIPEQLFNMPVEGISPGAFREKNLTSVRLPATLTRIEDACFALNALTAIEIPAGVTYIGMNAFAGNRIASLTIPDSVTYIGHSAFLGNRITTLTIPGSIKVLGSGVFHSNPIATLVLNRGLLVLGDGAFFETRLTAVDIPDTVVYIGANAFKGVNAPTTIKIGSGVSLARLATSFVNETFEAFKNNFDTYYTLIQHQQAGTYTFNTQGRTWSFSPNR